MRRTMKFPVTDVSLSPNINTFFNAERLSILNLQVQFTTDDAVSRVMGSCYNTDEFNPRHFAFKMFIEIRALLSVHLC